jgi:hypothetical protein
MDQQKEINQKKAMIDKGTKSKMCKCALDARKGKHDSD